MEAQSVNRILIGRVAGVYGLQGWVKVVSYTRPRENILQYRHWWLGHDGDWRVYERLAGRPQGRGLVAALAGVGDPDAARALVGSDIAIDREAMPAPAPGEYYWCDLLGLRVRLRDGRELGRVARLEETGANDVLVVEGPGRRQWLVPYVQDRYILDVDLQGGVITVDWSPED